MIHAINKVDKDPETLAVVKSIWTKLIDFVNTFDRVAQAEGQRTFSRIRSDMNIVQNRLVHDENLQRKMSLIRNRTVDFGDTLMHVTEVSSVTTMNGMAMSLLDVANDPSVREDMNEGA